MPTVETTRRLLHYRLVEEIGKGGMGVVFRAEDTKLQRTVAVKILQRPHDDVARRRLLREARLACALRHPGVVSVYALESTDELDFLVMEHLDAESLRDRLVAGPLPVPEILRAGIQVAEALGAAHAAGVLHRDIKPANVLLCSNGQAKLLDFGVAQLVHAPVAPRDADRSVAMDDATLTDSRGSTESGSDESVPRFAGTVAYMSPEQIRGDALDARSDLFSLGSTLYEVATGRRPFAGATPLWIGHAILHETPPLPSSLRPDLPRALDAVLLRALAKDPADRPPSADAFAAELRAIGEGGSPAHRGAAPKDLRGAWLLRAAIAGALGIAATALVMGRRAPTSTRDAPAPNAAAPSRASERGPTGEPVANAEPTTRPAEPAPSARATPTTTTTTTTRDGGGRPAPPRASTSTRPKSSANPVGDGIF